jgi:adenylylsulfate kinase-like enzyme
VERDSKGLYSKKTLDLTGVNQQFDPPHPSEDTSLVLNTATSSLSDMITLARGFVCKEGL